MKIRPYVVLGVGTVCAMTALLVIVNVSDPYAAERRMIALFWGALFLMIWGLAATTMSLFRQRLWPVVAGSGVFAVGAMGIIVAVHMGWRNQRLLGGLIVATIVLSCLAWWWARKGYEIGGYQKGSTGRSGKNSR